VKNWSAILAHPARKNKPINPSLDCGLGNVRAIILNSTELNRIKPNQTESNQIKPNQTKKIPKLNKITKRTHLLKSKAQIRNLPRTSLCRILPREGIGCVHALSFLDLKTENLNLEASTSVFHLCTSVAVFQIGKRKAESRIA
jgi:hypothetical protein